MRFRGFGVSFGVSLADVVFIQMDAATASAAKNLEAAASSYFKLPQEEKDKNNGADGNNLGYIKVSGIREFIKVRPSDSSYLWPSEQLVPEFKGVYSDFYERYGIIHIISWIVCV